MESNTKRNHAEMEEVGRDGEMDTLPVPARPLRKRVRTTTNDSRVTRPTGLLTPHASEESIDVVALERPRRPLRKRPTDGSRRKAAEQGSNSLVTPPTSAEDDNNTDTLLQNATHILLTEAAALNAAARLYSTSPMARSTLSAAVEAITSAQRRPNNKLVFCGVGKSAYIAQKLTATSKSLGIKTSFLHACEALHGDLGDVRAGDVVCFVTFSGKTPELMGLLPHLPERLTIIALCGKAEVQDCPLLGEMPSAGANSAVAAAKTGRTGILLSAPILQSEESSFGVSAPTTSTTVALAVGDMMVLTVAEGLYGEKKGQLFKKNHPGGAIGMTTTAKVISEVAVCVEATTLQQSVVS